MYFGDNSEKKLTDKRAVELWNIARNSGKFSQNELESIKVRKFFEIFFFWDFTPRIRISPLIVLGLLYYSIDPLNTSGAII